MSTSVTQNCCWLDASTLGQNINNPNNGYGGTCISTDADSNILSSVCLDYILDYCVNEPQDIETLRERWNTEPVLNIETTKIGTNENFKRSCYYPLSRMLFTDSANPDSTIANVAAGYQNLIQGSLIQILKEQSNIDNAKLLVEQLLKKYNELGYNVLSQPGESNAEPVGPGGTLFSNNLFNICKSYPYLCSDNLYNNICKNVTTKQMTLSNNLFRNWCGCNMQDSEYEEYSKISIDKTCTPFCNSNTVIPLGELANNNITCPQNICIIDNVTISILETSGGSINISNVCSGCYGKNNFCQCEIGDITIDTANSKLKQISGGTISLNNSCNSIPKCFRTNTLGEKIEVPCNSDYSKSVDEVFQETKNNQVLIETGYTFLVPAVLLLILLGIFVIIAVVKYLGNGKFKTE
jgi:hypothetical protein